MEKKTRGLIKINSRKVTEIHIQLQARFGKWLKKKKIQLAPSESKLAGFLTRITQIVDHRGTISIRPFIFCNTPHIRVKHEHFLGAEHENNDMYKKETNTKIAEKVMIQHI